MEEQWLVDRARLRELMSDHADWAHRQFAEEVGRSVGWVKKWRKRWREASPDDDTILYGLSRARKHPPASISREVVDRLLEIRDNPPENLKRIPGPLTILYYLHKDENLKASGARLPRSTRTVWRILDEAGRIRREPEYEHIPMERPEPMIAWQLDFKDVSSVAGETNGKQQHRVEVLNTVDCGTSILVDARPREDFTAETSLLTIAGTLLEYGRPGSITFDRDPRFVGSWAGKDFPSALIRFLLCLSIEVNVLPPQRPDLNAFVERYHRTYKYECLLIHAPTDVFQTRQVTHDFKRHYNFERPNQAITCGNQPPRMAFPSLPTLPALPHTVNPDLWLQSFHRQRLIRKIRSDGTVTVDSLRYYIKQKLRGRYVSLEIDAVHTEFIVRLGKKTIKQIPIKALYNELLPFDDYLQFICQEARTQWRRYRR